MADVEDIEKFCDFLKNSNQGLKDLTQKFYDLQVNSNTTTTTNGGNNESATYGDSFLPLNLSMEYDFASKQLNASYQKQILESCLKMNEFATAHSQRNLVRYNLVKHVYPFLLLFGIIGNLVSCLAMVKKYKGEMKSQRKTVHTFSFCLAILCFADLTILVLGGLSEYVEQVLEFSVRSSSVFACKFLYFTCYLFSSFVSYLYAFIALDRWQAATKPIEYKQKQTSRHHKQVLVISVYCFVICSPFFYFPTLIKLPDDTTSSNNTTFEKKCRLAVDLFKPLTLLDAIFYSFLPFIITFIFSTLTLIALIRERRSLYESTSGRTKYVEYIDIYML